MHKCENCGKERTDQSYSAKTCRACRSKASGLCTVQGCDKYIQNNEKGLCHNHLRGNCTSPNCANREHSKGYCQTHYRIAKRTIPDFIIPRTKKAVVHKERAVSNQKKAVQKRKRDEAKRIQIDNLDDLGQFKSVTVNAQILANRAGFKIQFLEKTLRSLLQDEIIHSYSYDKQSQLVHILIPSHLEFTLFAGLDQKPDGIFET